MNFEQMIGFGVAGNFAGHLEQAGEAADFTQVKTNILVRTGKPITEEGENLADYVLDSIADLPRIAKRLIK